MTVTGKAEGSSVPVEEQAADSAAADAADSSPKTEAAIGNPWNTFDTLEEAEACADVEITIPDQIDGYDVLIYQAIQGEILEIIYQLLQSAFYAQIHPGRERDGQPDGQCEAGRRS